MLYVHCLVLSQSDRPSNCSCRVLLLHLITHSVGVLWTRDRPVAETVIYTTHKIHNRQISMPSAGFEPAVPASERPQTHSVDRAAAAIGHVLLLRTAIL